MSGRAAGRSRRRLGVRAPRRAPRTGRGRARASGCRGRARRGPGRSGRLLASAGGARSVCGGAPARVDATARGVGRPGGGGPDVRAAEPPSARRASHRAVAGDARAGRGAQGGDLAGGVGTEPGRRLAGGAGGGYRSRAATGRGTGSCHGHRAAAKRVAGGRPSDRDSAVHRPGRLDRAPRANWATTRRNASAESTSACSAMSRLPTGAKRSRTSETG